MGQTASSTQQEEEQQQQQSQQSQSQRQSERDKERERTGNTGSGSGRPADSPSSNSTSRRSQAIRTGLHASRSLRGKGNDSKASGSSKDGAAAKDGGAGTTATGSTSPSKPRRKSLDMPDMSLSMSTHGHMQGYSSGSGAVTPIAGGGYDDPRDMDEGIPLAHGPVGSSSNASGVTSNLTSPTSPLHASSSISSRWGRGVRSRNNTATGALASHSNAEGLVKKAQPITGNASALHAAGYSADKATALPVLSTSPNMAQYTYTTSPPASAANTPTQNRVQLPAISTQNLQNQQLQQQQQQQRDFSSPSIHQQLSVGGGNTASASSSRSTSTARPGPGSTSSSAVPRDIPPSALGMLFQGPPSAIDTPLSSSPANGGIDGKVPPPLPSPLRQPTETILAPKLPPNVNLTIPLSPTNAAHDIIEAHSFVNMMSNTGQIFASPSIMGGGGTSSSSSNNNKKTDTSPQQSAPGSGISSPLLPNSTPPILNPPNTLPAAAPLSALNPALSSADPKTQEAVHAATVDLGAGPDGVPTLLTWKADQEVGMISMSVDPEDLHHHDHQMSMDSRASSPTVSTLVPGDVRSSSTGPAGQGGGSRMSASTSSSGNNGGGGGGGNGGSNIGEDGRMLHAPQTPEKVFVTGTFAKGWSTKIELRRKENDPKHGKDFTALVRLPPGPHSLKFIVDKQWKTSKYLPSATDADGNLINYLQVHKAGTGPRAPQHPVIDELEEEEEDEDEDQWSSSIPEVLLAYGEATESAADYAEAAELELEERNAAAAGGGSHSVPVTPLPSHHYGSYYDNNSSGNSPQTGGSSSIPTVLPNPGLLALNRKPLIGLNNIKPPTLPAQLEKGVLNATVLIAKGSGDDNSLLPKPDHSVLNHLAASPIKGGLLSVGVTTRYRRKYVTTVYYKKPM